MGLTRVRRVRLPLLVHRPSTPTLTRVVCVTCRQSPDVITIDTMTVRIDVGVRVSAPRGELLPPEPPRKRARRALKYGRVTASKGEHLWVVQWDDQTTSDEKSSQLKAEPANAAMPPLLPPPQPPLH